MSDNLGRNCAKFSHTNRMNPSNRRTNSFFASIQLGDGDDRFVGLVLLSWQNSIVSALDANDKKWPSDSKIDPLLSACVPCSPLALRFFSFSFPFPFSFSVPLSSCFSFSPKNFEAESFLNAKIPSKSDTMVPK